MKRVAVIGGGISGLATAYYLKKQSPQLEVNLFEANAKVGGIIQTHRSSAALMEHGPDAFIFEKPWALDLCRELGLDSEIISTRSENRQSFIFSSGKLRAVPAGFYLTAPKNFQAWWNLPGMSFFGKCRMLCDLFLPARKGSGDESVAEFVIRRFGKETLKKFAQPMIAGIYSSDPNSLSLLATFPQFREMERQHGSVIRALRATSADSSPSGARYALFLSLRGGMETLTQKLQKTLEKEIHLTEPVKNIEAREKGWGIQTGWGSYEVDALCFAVPSYEAAKMLEQVRPEISQALNQIQFEPIATLNFLFEKSAIQHPLNGFGFVVPASENLNLIGCSFSHQKFEGRVFESESVLLRAFVGGVKGRDLLEMSDEFMSEKILQELNLILGVHHLPTETLISRYPMGMPQYKVGHLEKMDHLFQLAKKSPGLFLVGNSYRGIGIPDCIHAAQQVSQEIKSYLGV